MTRMILNKFPLPLLLCIFSLNTFFSKAQIKNPILPGFYPDPSICRVDNDYYLVNSSFAYFPGVPVFHSSNLIHWKQIGHVLDRPSQLNLTDHGISRGIFAPAISYNKGLFYMITTFVDGGGNFYVTSADAAGPWSDPVWLPGIDGIDPSFFFDDDGRAYILNNGPPPENKPLYNGHRAIWIQEFDPEANKPVGKRQIIVNGGTDISKKPVWIEGPHIYRKNDYYYLMAAEGGTGTWHSEVIFRSRSVWGPYEVFEGNPILTQRDLPPDRTMPVTSSGHADLVQTAAGDWTAVFLACQPYSDNYYNTGRETFMLPVDWSGEWPVILEKGKVIPLKVELPAAAPSEQLTFAKYSENWIDEFDKAELAPEWIFIRTPEEKWYELKNSNLLMQARPVSINMNGNPSFLGRRQQHSRAQFTAAVRLEKGKEMEAGIIAFQNEKHYYKFVVLQDKEASYLTVNSAHEEISRIMLSEFNWGDEVYLRIKSLDDLIICEYSMDNKSWAPAGKPLDGKILSTQIAGGFVGTVFGIYTFAPSAARASFNWASYQKIDELK